MFNPKKNSNFDIKELKKFNGETAMKTCSQFKLSDEAKALLNEKITSPNFLKLLLENEFYHDAILFLAHGLPKREAIWWGYLCAEQTELTDKASEDVISALKLTKSWVYEPDEATRRAAEAAAEKLELKTASSWVALATFWSGGSITPLDKPIVLPNEYLSAKAVAGAIMLAAVSQEPEKISENYLHFIAQGIDISNNGNGKI